jgi:hypothetical protein
MCQSQEDVSKAFQVAFGNIKPRDAVVVGMYPEHVDQIATNVEYTVRACESVKQS